MSSIRPVNLKILECIFEKAGFKFKRYLSGKNRLLKKEGYKLGNINIPKEKDISVRIIKYNMGKANMTNDEYFFYLNECK